jgi:hypothetical protein
MQVIVSSRIAEQGLQPVAIHGKTGRIDFATFIAEALSTPWGDKLWGLNKIEWNDGTQSWVSATWHQDDATGELKYFHLGGPTGSCYVTVRRRAEMH